MNYFELKHNAKFTTPVMFTRQTVDIRDMVAEGRLGFRIFEFINELKGIVTLTWEELGNPADSGSIKLRLTGRLDIKKGIRN